MSDRFSFVSAKYFSWVLEKIALVIENSKIDFGTSLVILVVLAGEASFYCVRFRLLLFAAFSLLGF